MKKTKKMKEEKESGDIIELILEHHKELKKLIKTMKSEDTTLTQKKAAFEKFAPALVAHAKPEEKVLYKDMKNERDMKEESLEGDIEHGLADQLCSELKKTKDKDMYKAKVKVLAELVEHHIKEEEEDMFPSYRHTSTKDERQKLGKAYMKLREEWL